jgi:hypothetical protein
MIEIIPEVIEVQGRRRVKLTLRDGETILDADVVDPLNSTARRKVAQRLAERSGDALAAERIERGLLQCVELIEDGADRSSDDDGDELAAAPTVDVSRVVRGELFHAGGTIGLSVAEAALLGGAPVGRWRVYVASPDGSRRAAALTERLATSDEGVWVHPLPPPPSFPIVPTWSESSRNRWLDGEPAPKPYEVFAKLCAAFDQFRGVSRASRATGEVQGASEEPTPQAAVLALWTMLTYCFPSWDAVPYLYVNGPAGSGRRACSRSSRAWCSRGFTSSNLSAAALFRTLHERGGTLLLDEAERLIEGAPEVAELRSILLAGYKRGGKASRLESNRDSFQMTEFCVFGPKAIACINELPAALSSRCIPIQMFRNPPTSSKPQLRVDADRSRWIDLRDALHALALRPLGEAAPVLANQDDACTLSGRAYELWQPLLSIAQWLDASASCDRHAPDAGQRSRRASRAGPEVRWMPCARRRSPRTNSSSCASSATTCVTDANPPPPRCWSERGTWTRRSSKVIRRAGSAPSCVAITWTPGAQEDAPSTAPPTCNASMTLNAATAWTLTPAAKTDPVR